MKDERLSNLLFLRERLLPSSPESIITNDVIPLLVSIKKDLEEIKARLINIEEKLGLRE
ncbi:MAG: hypothetical protein N3F04_03530 [Candidatus Nezhaarchaeota archaeon]|nr:hypothetical protein [Candidatus Nezhaarchaeota archaeon]MCX8141835.1 hypothetical protein [Candidatus Nezhaarchaeota archaeon]MDW8050384.1 hypothetical protein [Nitrososphaerota archaeon]